MRRNNGRTFEKNHHLFINTDVVSYNPYLSVKYACHINVEVATGIEVVKYLYKYIYKDHDHIYISVETDGAIDESIDEIKEYMDARYMSVYEDSWRIFKFALHVNYPAVHRLQLYLPDMQSVIFDPDVETGEEVLDRDKNHKINLIEFFIIYR